MNLAKTMAGEDLSGELVIVDDGSTDCDYKSNAELVNSVNGVPINLLRHKKNKGKGAAVQTGFKEAKGTWIGFVDADGATAPEEILRLVKLGLSSKDLDGVFGSRIRMLGHNVDRKALRHYVGRVFATLASLLLAIPIYDSQCGCKFFRKSRILPILDICHEQGWLLDIELITIGYHKKLNFLEVPISWKDVPGAKIHLFKASLRMAYELLKMRKRLQSIGMMPR